jgi:glucokinase
MKKYVIGVDIGGTKIAAGIISSGGKLVSSVVLPTNAGGGKDSSVKQVYLAIERLIDGAGIGKRAIKGIGVCAPGPLDPQKGVIYNPPNIPGWNNLRLASLIEKRTGIETKLENDANAAGVAEMVWGAGKGYKDILYVTVSTGVGTGIIIDGRVYYGKNGMAGEGGHVTINYDADGDVCGCGRKGCIEALASGPHTVRRFIKALKKRGNPGTKVMDMVGGDRSKITMETIARAAEKGDKMAAAAIREQGRLIGIWLGGMISILDPEIVIIGGGVSLIGDRIFKEIRRSMAENSVNIFALRTPVVPAKLKKDVGIFGAASVFMI